MASGQTANFGLNQWEPGDQVLREEFNADNLKIEQALALRPRIATGSYVGTGTYGSDNPTSLTFDFEPKLVVLEVNSAYALRPGTVFVAGQTKNSGIGYYSSSSYTLNLNVTWAGNTVSWYTDASASEEDRQFNASGVTYFYFAIGL